MKLNVWFFKILGVYKSPIFWMISIYIISQISTSKFDNLEIFENPDSIIPEEILTHLEQKGFKYNFFESKNENLLNIVATPVGIQLILF